MKKLAILFALIGFGLGACERHEWESKPGKPGTSEFYKHAPADDKKGDSHGEEKDAH